MLKIRTINFRYLFSKYTDVEIGFDKTEVTVIEGETILLTASFKNNISSTDYGGSGFSVYVYDKGNITGILYREPSTYDNNRPINNALRLLYLYK